MKKILRIIFSAFGGTLTGLGLGLLPQFGIFSEIRHFQIFLIEMSYQGIAKFAPPSVMRILGAAPGELFILGLIGGAIGLLGGILFFGLGSEKSGGRNYDPLRTSLTFTSGIFAFLFAMLWCRIVFIHSSNQRMISSEGFLMLAGSVFFGTVTAAGTGFILRKLSRFRLDRLFLLAALAALGAGYFGFFSKTGAASATSSSFSVKQVILLGGDGATWDVALPLIREGKLPHLEQLIKEGSWGDIRTTIPWKSPILWTSMATGKRKEKHGIYDFVTRDKKSHEIRPVSLNSRKVKAVWDIVSEAGRRVDVVNWYGAWPAEPVNGTMLASRFTFDLPDRVYPPTRLAELENFSNALPENDTPRDEQVAAEAGLYLLERDQPELHLMYLREIDDMQHFFWRYHAVRRGSPLARLLYGNIKAEELEEKGKKIEEAYLRLDETLGRILKMAGPETAVVIVSDHGAGIKALGEIHFSLNPILEAWGLTKISEDYKKSSWKSSVDWKESKIYDSTKPFKEDREIFINLKPEGPFGGKLEEPLKQELLHSAAEKLGRLRTDSGEVLMKEIRVTEGDEGPYLFVRMNVHLKKAEKIYGEGIEIPISDVLWHTELTGTHRLQGLIAMKGPGIKANHRLRAAGILDVTPTLLYLLNLPVADDMEGRPLLEAFEPGTLKANALKRVPTYETTPRLQTAPSHEEVVDKELMEKLQSLGYIQ